MEVKKKLEITEGDELKLICDPFLNSMSTTLSYHRSYDIFNLGVFSAGQVELGAAFKHGDSPENHTIVLDVSWLPPGNELAYTGKINLPLRFDRSSRCILVNEQDVTGDIPRAALAGSAQGDKAVPTPPSQDPFVEGLDDEVEVDDEAVDFRAVNKNSLIFDYFGFAVVRCNHIKSFRRVDEVRTHFDVVHEYSDMTDILAEFGVHVLNCSKMLMEQHNRRVPVDLRDVDKRSYIFRSPDSYWIVRCEHNEIFGTAKGSVAHFTKNHECGDLPDIIRLFGTPVWGCDDKLMNEHNTGVTVRFKNVSKKSYIFKSGDGSFGILSCKHRRDFHDPTGASAHYRPKHGCKNIKDAINWYLTPVRECTAELVEKHNNKKKKILPNPPARSGKQNSGDLKA